MNVEKPIFITGEAGTGKTTRLMDLTVEYCAKLLVKPYQRALAMAVMHGARRRLKATLAEKCPKVPKEICTMHSFALGLTNRWRSSLGANFQIVSGPVQQSFSDKYFRTRISFDEAVRQAVRLLESPTVAKYIAASYPLIIVDEFQDCTGPTLDLIKALVPISKLLLAGDPYQLLDVNESRCEAVEWVRTLKEAGAVEYFELGSPQRTDVANLLEAARCIRRQIRSETGTIPVFYGQTPEMVAWRMVERFISKNPAIRIKGTCAVICPGRDPLLTKLFRSFERQLARKNPKLKVRWLKTMPQNEEESLLLKELGITDPDSDMSWKLPKKVTSARALAIRQRVERFCTLRGVKDIRIDLASAFARESLHAERSHGLTASRHEVMTVHGAKNREFDHVFVFWGFKVAPGQEKQRRLLYNAITRAKKQCVLLVVGDDNRFETDPVLSLLGKAEPAIKKKQLQNVVQV